MFGFPGVMDQQIGPSFEEGLEQLKELAEGEAGGSDE